MDGYRAGRLAFRGLDITDVDVRLLGETALVWARTLGTRVEEGRETENRVRYLRVWAGRGRPRRRVARRAADGGPAAVVALSRATSYDGPTRREKSPVHVRLICAVD